MCGRVFQFAVYPDAVIEEIERNSNTNIEVVNSHKKPRASSLDTRKGVGAKCDRAQVSLPHGCLSTGTTRKKYYIYILDCEPEMTGNVYVGQTNNIARRICRHIIGSGAIFTRNNKPRDLLHLEVRYSQKEALQRESELIRAFKHGEKVKIDLPLEFFGFFLELTTKMKKYPDQCAFIDFPVPIVPEWEQPEPPCV